MHCSCPMNIALGVGPKKEKGLKRKMSKRGRDPNAHIILIKYWILFLITSNIQLVFIPFKLALAFSITHDFLVIH